MLRGLSSWEQPVRRPQSARSDRRLRVVEECDHLRAWPITDACSGGLRNGRSDCPAKTSGRAGRSA
eukprot:1693151-Pyramimonas_sp.AAC.1